MEAEHKVRNLTTNGLGSTASHDGSPDNRTNEIDLKLLTLCEKIGYEISQHNAQRILGPPAIWHRNVPTKNSEVFVGKIPKDCYEDELYPFFSEIGPVYMIRLMMDHSRLNKGYGFVTYPDFDTAQKAVLMLDRREIRPGHKLVVMMSTNHCRLVLHNLPLSVGHTELLKKQIMKYEITGLTSVEIRPYENCNAPCHYARLEFGSHRDAALARRKLLGECQVLWSKDTHLQWAPIELADFPQHNKLRYNQHWNKHISLYNKDTKRNSSNNNNNNNSSSNNCKNNNNNMNTMSNGHQGTASHMFNTKNGLSSYQYQLYQQVASLRRNKRLSSSEAKVLDSFLINLRNSSGGGGGGPRKLAHDIYNGPQLGSPNVNFNSNVNGNGNGMGNGSSHLGTPIHGSVNLSNLANFGNLANMSSSPNLRAASGSNFNHGPHFTGAPNHGHGQAGYNGPSGSPNYNGNAFNSTSYYSDADWGNANGNGHGNGGRRISSAEQSLDQMTRHLSRLSFSPNESLASDEFVFDCDPLDFHNPRLLNYTPSQSPVPYSPTSNLSPRNYAADNQFYRASPSLGYSNGGACATDPDQSFFHVPDNTWDAFQSVSAGPGTGVGAGAGTERDYDYFGVISPPSSLGTKSNPNSPLRVPTNPREPNSLESPNSSVTSSYDSSRQEKDLQRSLNQGVIYPAPPELQWSNFEGFGGRDLLQEVQSSATIGMGASHRFGDMNDFDLQMNVKGGANPKKHGHATKANYHGRLYKRGSKQWH